MLRARGPATRQQISIRLEERKEAAGRPKSRERRVGHGRNLPLSPAPRQFALLKDSARGVHPTTPPFRAERGRRSEVGQATNPESPEPKPMRVQIARSRLERTKEVVRQFRSQEQGRAPSPTRDHPRR